MFETIHDVVKVSPAVMVEVKPTDAATLRYAIRSAIGQVLDYRQDQRWTGPQLIVVETKVIVEDALRLAFGKASVWPGRRRADSTVRWPV